MLRHPGGNKASQDGSANANQQSPDEQTRRTGERLLKLCPVRALRDLENRPDNAENNAANIRGNNIDEPANEDREDAKSRMFMFEWS